MNMSDFAMRLTRPVIESGWRRWERAVQIGARRAPLELIAYVVKENLPYSEILTANYVMANPTTAKAYGSTTVFEDADDVREFRPTQITEYYRERWHHGIR